MRKILYLHLPAWVIIILLLYSSFGYFAVYKGMQYSVRKEVKRKLKRTVPIEDLHLLKITKQVEKEAHINIFQRIHEGEFRYYGEMYDIVYKQLHGDTTYYFCIHDKEEEVLFTNLETAINNFIAENPASKRKQQGLVKQLVKEYISPERFTISLINKYKEINFPAINPNLVSLNQKVASPPPQSC